MKPHFAMHDLRMDPNRTNSQFYTKCFANLSDADRSHLLNKELDQKYMDRIATIYMGYTAIPLAFVASIAVITYIIGVHKAMKVHSVSRKFYSLLLNRAFGDAMTILVYWIITAYVLIVTDVNRNVMQILSTMFIASFWSAMFSYVGQSVMKLYGVARPLQYRQVVTMSRCKKLVLISWLIFFLILVYTLTVVAVTKIPTLSNLTGCRTENCLHYMYRGRNLLMIIVYLFTILCFVITVILIRRAHRVAQSFHSKSNSKSAQKTSITIKRRFRYPLFKLGLNVSTFAIFTLPYAIWAAVLFAADGCFYLFHFNTMTKGMGLVRVAIMLRIITDSILSFVLEREIRRGFLSTLPGIGKTYPAKPSISSARNHKTLSTNDSSELSNTSTFSPTESRLSRAVSKSRSASAKASMDTTVTPSGSSKSKWALDEESQFTASGRPIQRARTIEFANIEAAAPTDLNTVAEVDFVASHLPPEK